MKLTAQQLNRKLPGLSNPVTYFKKHHLAPSTGIFNKAKKIAPPAAAGIPTNEKPMRKVTDIIVK